MVCSSGSARGLLRRARRRGRGPRGRALGPRLLLRQRAHLGEARELAHLDRVGVVRIQRAPQGLDRVLGEVGELELLANEEDLVAELLRRFAHPDSFDPEKGRTALHAAINVPSSCHL